MNKNLCLTTSTDRHLCVMTIIPVVHSAAVSVSGTSNNIPTSAGLTAKVNMPCAACHESFCRSVVTAPHTLLTTVTMKTVLTSQQLHPQQRPAIRRILNPDRPPKSKPLYWVDGQSIPMS